MHLQIKTKILIIMTNASTSESLTRDKSTYGGFTTNIAHLKVMLFLAAHHLQVIRTPSNAACFNIVVSKCLW